jgi:hypothetical protein
MGAKMRWQWTKAKKRKKKGNEEKHTYLKSYQCGNVLPMLAVSLSPLWKVTSAAMCFSFFSPSSVAKQEASCLRLVSMVAATDLHRVDSDRRAIGSGCCG